MAASVIGILSTLGLSEDSTLQQVLDKLIDYNLVTTDELHNIQNISVKPLPNIVRNQADILKQRMYGIATDEDYGLPIVINRRMVLTRYILEKLNIKIDDIKKALEDGTLIVNKAYNDELGNNIKDTYETKTDATNKNNTITTRVQKLEDELSDGTFVVKKAENDSEGNKIVETYETKSNASATKTNLETKITTAETNAKNYTDSEFTRLYNLILGGYSEQSYDTFKEIADYISSDKTGASQMLSSIQSNKSEINTLKSTKANSSDVYNKTVIDTKVNEINAKIDEVQTGNSIELANYYTKTESDGKYLPLSGGTLTGDLDLGTNGEPTSGGYPTSSKILVNGQELFSSTLDNNGNAWQSTLGKEFMYLAIQPEYALRLYNVASLSLKNSSGNEGDFLTKSSTDVVRWSSLSEHSNLVGGFIIGGLRSTYFYSGANQERKAYIVNYDNSYTQRWYDFDNYAKYRIFFNYADFLFVYPYQNVLEDKVDLRFVEGQSEKKILDLLKVSDEDQSSWWIVPYIEFECFKSPLMNNDDDYTGQNLLIKIKPYYKWLYDTYNKEVIKYEMVEEQIISMVYDPSFYDLILQISAHTHDSELTVHCETQTVERI